MQCLEQPSTASAITNADNNYVQMASNKHKKPGKQFFVTLLLPTPVVVNILILLLWNIPISIIFSENILMIIKKLMLVVLGVTVSMRVNCMMVGKKEW